MKTAEEYIREWQQKVEELSSIDAGTKWCDEERVKFWKAALLDAYKAGMTEGAEIASRQMLSHTNGAELLILSARDRKENL